jgi:DNA-binding FadR family transcriptional regulator
MPSKSPKSDSGRASAANGGGVPRRDPGSIFEPVEQLRAHEYVAEQIRRQIALRLIPLGNALPTERQLATQFGVGRATVQNALRLLEADRLVESRRGRNGGTFVVGPTTDDLAMDYLLARLRHEAPRVREALDFRALVEPAGASMAAKRLKKSDLDEIVVAATKSATAETDIEFQTHDTEFHLAIARTARNGFIYDAVERLRLVLADPLAALPASKVWQQRSSDQHAAILQALKRRDPGEAAEAMAAHLRATAKSVHALIASL